MKAYGATQRSTIDSPYKYSYRNYDLNHVCVTLIEHMYYYIHTSYRYPFGEAMTGASCRLVCAPDRRLTSSIGELGELG